jgi:hypothetical protein
MMQVRLLLLLSGMLWGWDVVGKASEDTSIISESAQYFHHHSEVSLSWINGVKQWQLSNPRRQIGLTSFDTELSWREWHQASLWVELRPEALLSERVVQGKAYEFERRVGSVYQGATRVEFLDLYRIQFDFSDSFAVGVGLFRDLYSPLVAFPSVLEFGLATRFPEKFYGGKVMISQKQAFLASTANPFATGKTLDWSLYVFSGTPDRAEYIEFSKESLDQGPTIADAHFGISTEVTSYFHPKWTGFFSIGLFERQENLTERRDCTFGEATLQHRADLGLPLVSSLDVRVSHDIWKTPLQFPAVWQTSIAWKTRLEQNSGLHYLLGVEWGQSQRPLAQEKRTTFQGYQVEAGLRKKLRGMIFSNFMVSYENRREKGEGSWGNGFSTKGSSHTMSHLYRVAIELQYILGS